MLCKLYLIFFIIYQVYTYEYQIPYPYNQNTQLVNPQPQYNSIYNQQFPFINLQRNYGQIPSNLQQNTPCRTAGQQQNYQYIEQFPFGITNQQDCVDKFNIRQFPYGVNTEQNFENKVSSIGQFSSGITGHQQNIGQIPSQQQYNIGQYPFRMTAKQDYASNIGKENGLNFHISPMDSYRHQYFGFNPSWTNLNPRHPVPVSSVQMVQENNSEFLNAFTIDGKNIIYLSSRGYDDNGKHGLLYNGKIYKNFTLIPKQNQEISKPLQTFPVIKSNLENCPKELKEYLENLRKNGRLEYILRSQFGNIPVTIIDECLHTIFPNFQTTESYTTYKSTGDYGTTIGFEDESTETSFIEPINE